MEIECEWRGKSSFVATMNGLRVRMEAPQKPFSKTMAEFSQLDFISFCSRIGMDSICHLQDRHQEPLKVSVQASAENSHSLVGSQNAVKLIFNFYGSCKPSCVLEAVEFSLQKVRNKDSGTPALSVSINLNGKALTMTNGRSELSHAQFEHQSYPI